jgi:N-terminal acetyltransferase B complex catalytic subunit
MHWHGHVSAVTVAPTFRRQGIAKALMNYLEEVTAKIHNAWFVDLFVRPSNDIAVGFYKGLGYDVYRSVTGYYGDQSGKGGEDAYDMRKAMPRDK